MDGDDLIYLTINDNIQGNLRVIDVLYYRTISFNCL